MEETILQMLSGEGMRRIMIIREEKSELDFFALVEDIHFNSITRALGLAEMRIRHSRKETVRLTSRRQWTHKKELDNESLFLYLSISGDQLWVSLKG